MRRVLIVEDEQHKLASILRLLKRKFGKSLVIDHHQSVQEAVFYLYKAKISNDLVILDIALPTFGADDEIGGNEQASGGVEVIRAFQHLRLKPKIVILTQYPEIVINGHSIGIADAAGHIKKNYGQDVIAAIPYQYDDLDWEVTFLSAVEGVQ
jgi:DNA-binding NarL/FixJ family response regulator